VTDTTTLCHLLDPYSGVFPGAIGVAQNQNHALAVCAASNSETVIGRAPCAHAPIRSRTSGKETLIPK
jgi:hypothetical protein